jgi:alpha-tubulin suppressor-like RCC1 family protein
MREATVVPLTTSAAIMHVGVGLTHACALLADGSVWCWGDNTGGQRGDGTTLQSPAPTAVEGGHSFSELSVGAVHSCARAAGEVWCWGLNLAVALGDGTSVDRAYILPESVTLTFPATAVTAGPAFTCVLDASSRVLCAGARAARSWGKR